MSRKRRGRHLTPASDWLDFVGDDMPDGAALAMAADMGGYDYDDFISELACEADVSERPAQPKARKRRRRKRK